MICSHCEKYELFLHFEEFLVSNDPMSSMIDKMMKCIKIAYEDFECDNCGFSVMQGESYIEDDVMFYEIIFRYMAEQIMNNIACCEQCGDGENIQGLYPSIKSCFYDKDDDPEAIFESLNTASTIEDIMNSVFAGRQALWEPYYEDIVDFVQCPSCDNGSGPNYDDKIDYGTFNLYTEVYTQEDIDQFNHDFYGDELEEAKIEISELAQKFSFEELVSFKNEYIQNKSYATRNSLFYSLEVFIKGLFTQQKYYVLSENRLVFRTRTAPTQKPLTKGELWEPPYAVASHGRYNDIGVSMLYCANNREIVKKEITLKSGYEYNIAKFIVHKPMLLFPINHVFGGQFAGLINEAVPANQQKLLFKQQYIISNIVSAICYQVGYDGIVYRSTKDNVSINYALFCKYKKGEDIEILNVDI